VPACSTFKQRTAYHQSWLMARTPLSTESVMTNMQLADGSMSDTSGAQSSRKAATQTCVGSLTRSLPAYVRNPPIEAAVFAWGVAEDGQLVRCCLQC
jgi:hypothetical protein